MKATSDPFYAMLGKALVDPEYQGRLLDETTRADALKELGIEHPTEDQLRGVGNAKTALETLRNVFGDEFGAA
jgi:hypothetical protein